MQAVKTRRDPERPDDDNNRGRMTVVRRDGGNFRLATLTDNPYPSVAITFGYGQDLNGREYLTARHADGTPLVAVTT